MTDFFKGLPPILVGLGIGVAILTIPISGCEYHPVNAAVLGNGGAECVTRDPSGSCDAVVRGEMVPYDGPAVAACRPGWALNPENRCVQIGSHRPLRYPGSFFPADVNGLPLHIDCRQSALLATNEELETDLGFALCEDADYFWITPDHQISDSRTIADLFGGTEFTPPRLPRDFFIEYETISGSGFDVCNAKPSGHNRECHIVTCTRPTLIRYRHRGLDYAQMRSQYVACDPGSETSNLSFHSQE